MRLVFLSNFLNHHQLPFCLEMHRQFGDSFHFIATTPIFEEQLALGYPDLNERYPFVVRTYEDDNQKEKAYELSIQADVVLIGNAPKEYISQRLKEGKLTFLYSERIYKKGFQAWKLPVRIPRLFWKFGRHKSLYLLCASAYTACDFAKTFTFRNKAYKWGYFPESIRYEDINALIDKKKPATILWVGRFIRCKHPEYVLEVAQRLINEGYDFLINMIGCGQLDNWIGEQVIALGLDNNVHLLGSMPPEQVRKNMEASEIFLFTSDRNEGWGAVLNESMNSGCAVVASDAIGSVPFLINDGENGFTFQSGNDEDLYQKVKYLLDSRDIRQDLGRKAYETITGLWNAEVAVKRLLELSEALLRGEKYPTLFLEGPCSKAEIIKD